MEIAKNCLIVFVFSKRVEDLLLQKHFQRLHERVKEGKLCLESKICFMQISRSETWSLHGSEEQFMSSRCS
ncbi:CLUMA_CG001618, isoform A [Clunio marinus]|uniref:CLUMA_CG001618, isoform A n=1 Tax=Clunio marinus TaxID=568069 RepID=A0A1J1HMY8_9DIPT|nr:CLUMA_CG001618, isoform A [Clunio marinus]